MNEDSSVICVVCCQRVTSGHKKWFFAIGKCDHWVCFECSTRMRVLCKQNECPICRQQLNEVVFTRYKDKKFEDFDLQKCLYHNDYGIYFEDEESLEAYGKLLEHPCRKCRNRVFPRLNDLTTHLRKDHELFFCDLCVENLKSFTHERKYYTRKELARHRKTGDPDETSHRGHPICTFCDERYVDDEDLHSHLRREHFYCHFCDPSGFSHFYADYSALRDHFISQHFLCKECDSKEEKFTNAFRSEIDLQVHIAQYHTHNMSKSDQKKAKTLSLDLFIRQRSGHLDNGQQTRKQIKKEMRRNPTNNIREHHTSEESDDNDESTQNPAPIQPPRPEDFPSLCANTSAASTAITAKANDLKESKKPSKKPNTYSVYLSKNSKINTTNDDEFPALPGGSRGMASNTSDSISYNKLAKQQKSLNISKPQQNVRKNINLIDSSAFSSAQNKKVPNKPLLINREEFPSLPVTKKKSVRQSTVPSNHINSPNKNESTIEWTNCTTIDSKLANNETKAKTSVPKNSLKSLSNFDEFPSLETNKKKTTAPSMVSKPVTQSRPTASQPPPGLSSVKKKSSNLSLSSVAQQVISTSSGDSSQSSDSDPFSNDFCYINPIDFNERNQILVKKLDEVLSDRSKFLLFKEVSKQFRQSMITGDQYFQKCIDLLGRNKFSAVFSELLVLLPDIRKQNELLKAQQMDVKNTKGAIPKGSKLLNDCNSNEFIICSKCRQVLITKDQTHHMSAH